MHPNPAFRRETEDRALAMARERGFGGLTIVGPEGVLSAFIPFVVEDGILAAHLVRSNPIARHLRFGPVQALMMVWGPDAYISPDWYGEEDKVPTWNYTAVNLRGELRLIGEDRLKPHLERLSDNFEARLAPKPAWKLDKVSPGEVEKMMRQLVPVEMDVTSIESTFKLNQNRTDQARLGAADELAKGGTPGLDPQGLAALMRGSAG